MLHKVVLPPDVTVQIQFRRKNLDYVYGPVITFTTIKNTKPPAKPSTPVVSAHLGQLVVAWDGQSADGTTYLPDFDRCEVHVGPDANFTPNNTTSYTQFIHFGSMQQTVVSDLEYNKTYYIKLVAYNRSGIASEPSNEAHDTVRRISGIELEDGSINVDNLDLSRRKLRQNLVYYQAEQPSASRNPGNAPHWNDTWFDTDNNYKYYRYTHSGNEYTQGANESWEAFYDRNDAATDLTWKEIPVGTANQVPGARVWYQSSDPAITVSPPPVDGDMWYQTGQTGGVVPKVRRSGAWTNLQWGVGVMGPGSIVGDNIVGNTITGDKFIANSINSRELNTDAVLARHIKAGSVTADAVLSNKIITNTANIGTGVIDDAHIANLSAGKITTGEMKALITLSGSISTANTGARVVIDQYGIQLFSSNGAVTFYASTASGYANITGNVFARVFRSVGSQTAGYGYIELGNSGPLDPTDEIAMYYGGSKSTIRNPSDLPGAIRFSLSRSTAVAIDLTSTELHVPSGWRIKNRTANTWVGVEGDRINLRSNAGGSELYIHGADGNGNMLIRNSSNNGAALKISANENMVQVRTAFDSGYANLRANQGYFERLQSNGELNGNNLLVNFNIQTINGQIFSGGRINGSGGASITGNSGMGMNFSPYNNYTAPVQLYVGGNVYATSELISDNNITSRSGFMYSRGHSAYSNPDFKANITKLTVDPVELMKNVTVNIWEWRGDDGEPNGIPSIGLLTSELPNIVAPPEEGSPNGNSYSQSALDAVIISYLQNLNSRLATLEDRLASQ